MAPTGRTRPRCHGTGGKGCTCLDVSKECPVWRLTDAAWQTRPALQGSGHPHQRLAHHILHKRTENHRGVLTRSATHPSLSLLLSVLSFLLLLEPPGRTRGKDELGSVQAASQKTQKLSSGHLPKAKHIFEGAESASPWSNWPNGEFTLLTTEPEPEADQSWVQHSNTPSHRPVRFSSFQLLAPFPHFHALSSFNFAFKSAAFN